MNKNHCDVLIIGAGPAGLTAAYEINKRHRKTIVIEKDSRVGGISRTEIYKGYRFDIGGHRFYTKVAEVQDLWHEILEKDLIKVSRLSRIYYQNKFYNYPISIFQALSNLGLRESILILSSYLKAKLKRTVDVQFKAETFEDWARDCFGDRLYRVFFKTYTEKVWGIPCSQIRADWAAQRIQHMSLKRALLNTVRSSQKAKSLIKEFEYPRLGPGMMWERCQELIENQSSPVYLNTQITRVERKGNRITGVIARKDDSEMRFCADFFINTMPISALIQRLDPLPPETILEAARGLKYRDFLIVPIIINRAVLFPDNWLYIHSPGFQVGRIQNFKNWSIEMVPDPSKTCLGMEYFCSEGDALWSMSNTDLIKLATQEIVKLNLGVVAADVEDGTVIRQHKAYPVYDNTYRNNLKILQDYLATFENLQTVGRNGMHRYNNQDHSMVTAMLAVKNIFGERHNLWDVNMERSYHEDFTVDKNKVIS